MHPAWTDPSDRGALRWEQRSSTAAGRPAPSRKSARGRSIRMTPSGLRPSDDERHTGYHHRLGNATEKWPVPLSPSDGICWPAYGVLHGRPPGSIAPMELGAGQLGAEQRMTNDDDRAVVAVVAHGLIGSIGAIRLAISTLRQWDALDPDLRVRMLELADRQAVFVSELLADLVRGLPEEALGALEGELNRARQRAGVSR